MVSMGLSSTSSRVIRGPKAKLFLYICAVLVITGLVACYNSTLSQLDEVKKSNFVCHRQQENLSTQLQGKFAFWYKLNEVKQKSKLGNLVQRLL